MWSTIDLLWKVAKVAALAIAFFFLWNLDANWRKQDAGTVRQADFYFEAIRRDYQLRQCGEHTDHRPSGAELPEDSGSTSPSIHCDAKIERTSGSADHDVSGGVRAQDGVWHRLDWDRPVSGLMVLHF